MSDESEIEKLGNELTEKQKIFCHNYIVDWNARRSAIEAGYSEKTAGVIASENLTKPKIKAYIELIKDDHERQCGLSKMKQIKEYMAIAYSSIAHLHDSWIDLKTFENLTEDQKKAIESIETKTESVKSFNEKIGEYSPVEVKYVKIKLYSKISALEKIDKLMGYNEAEKVKNLNYNSEPLSKEDIDAMNDRFENEY